LAKSMAVSYDQMSELSIAFQEAHIPADRRRTQRIKQRIAAEISEWENNRVGRTFGVTVEDFSPTGVGFVHSGRLKEGGKYLLEIPRPGHKPVGVLLTVVRCDQLDGGLFSTRMEVSELLAGRLQATADAKRRARLRVMRMATAVGVFLGSAILVYFVNR
jgi:hypothetical protein